MSSNYHMHWYIISKTAVYLTLWEKKHECLLMPTVMSESVAPFVAWAHRPTNQQALVFHYLSRQVRRTCVMRRGFKLDWTASAASVHSSPTEKTGHHGELWSWEQTFQVDMWETSQGQLIPFSGEGLFSCQQGLTCGGGCNWNTPTICRHVATPSIWKSFLCFCTNIKAEEIHLTWFYDTFL